MIDPQSIFNVKNKSAFTVKALEVFKYQYANNQVYQDYCNAINIGENHVREVEQIPFLPIRFFKSQKVIVHGIKAEKVFVSSGTSGGSFSRHFVGKLEVYQSSFVKCFEAQYGPLEEFCILALLPSYLEQKDASLVYMVKEMINQSSHSDSGFYLDNIESLVNQLGALFNKGQKVLLLGVSFALLDLIEHPYFNDFKGYYNWIIMETGGMKGRREEMVRAELHRKLSDRLKTSPIHSEYGMTELLSQAYSKGQGRFQFPHWAQVYVRDFNDPFSRVENGQAGGINIIDLANVYSCSFIATDDLGRKWDDDTFEVLGRMDHSDVRGCSQMV